MPQYPINNYVFQLMPHVQLSKLKCEWWSRHFQYKIDMISKRCWMSYQNMLVQNASNVSWKPILHIDWIWNKSKIKLIHKYQKGRTRIIFKILPDKTTGKWFLGKLIHRWEENIRMNLKEIDTYEIWWIQFGISIIGELFVNMTYPYEHFPWKEFLFNWEKYQEVKDQVISHNWLMKETLLIYRENTWW